MPTVGYLPFSPTDRSIEAEALAEHLGVAVRLVADAPVLDPSTDRGWPSRPALARVVDELIDLPAVVVEGPAGLAWATVLRACGFEGAITILPYLNPRGWSDVAAAALYRRFAWSDDRVFVGSNRSASVYAALGVPVTVGEPYGIDDRVFSVRPPRDAVREELGIAPGPVVLYAGRCQPDKDVYAIFRAGLKLRLLFPDVQIVIASHVVDVGYLDPALAQLDADDGVHVVVDPPAARLAELYNLADVFVTASTSHFETFGRAPAEALACGTPAVAPRYDGFVDVLDQPGGRLVELDATSSHDPRIDDDALLRALFDVLSGPAPRRDAIAGTARRRFGRSTTIRLLGSLADGGPRPPIDEVAPADLVLPDAWRDPLREIDRRSPMAALDWLSAGCPSVELARHDDEHIGHVRRSLAGAAPASRRLQEASRCR